MHFGTRRAFKSVVAARIAALLAWSARDRGDRVGAVIRSAARIGEHPPSCTDSLLFALLSGLAQGTDAHEGEVSETLDESCERLAARARSGCQVYLLSDFSELEARGRECLADLARRTDLTCLAIHDPLEAAAPPQGRYRVSNGRDICSVSTGGRAFAESWAQDFVERRQALTEFCQSHRISLVSMATEDEELDALLGPCLGSGRSVMRRAA
jgi:uncharacterized protein (DUF58 family)